MEGTRERVRCGGRVKGGEHGQEGGTEREVDIMVDCYQNKLCHQRSIYFTIQGYLRS